VDPRTRGHNAEGAERSSSMTKPKMAYSRGQTLLVPNAAAYNKLGGRRNVTRRQYSGLIAGHNRLRSEISLAFVSIGHSARRETGSSRVAGSGTWRRCA
jgi:hypothetical protein